MGNIFNYQAQFQQAQQAALAAAAAANAATAVPAVVPPVAGTVSPVLAMGSVAAGNYDGEESEPYEEFLGIRIRFPRLRRRGIFHDHAGPVSVDQAPTSFDGDDYDHFLGIFKKIFKKNHRKHPARPVRKGSVKSIMQRLLHPDSATSFEGDLPEVAEIIHEYTGMAGDAVVCDCGHCSKDYDHFLGIAIGKKAKKRKQEKHEVKIAKKKAKNEARLIKANAKLELAKQGIDSSFGAQLSQGLGAVSNLMGSGGSGGDSSSIPAFSPTYMPPTPAQMQQAAETLVPNAAGVYTAAGDEQLVTANEQRLEKELAKKAAEDEKKEKDKKTMIIVGVILAVLIIAAVLIKKKK